MGECDLWHLDLPGVLGEAPWARGAPQVSALLPPRPRLLGDPRPQSHCWVRGDGLTFATLEVLCALGGTSARPSITGKHECHAHALSGVKEGALGYPVLLTRLCPGFQLRALCHHGQVEGCGAREDESWRECQVPRVPGVAGGLRAVLVPAGQVQQQGRGPLPGQGGAAGQPGALLRAGPEGRLSPRGGGG